MELTACVNKEEGAEKWGHAELVEKGGGRGSWLWRSHDVADCRRWGTGVVAGLLMCVAVGFLFFTPHRSGRRYFIFGPAFGVETLLCK